MKTPKMYQGGLERESVGGGGGGVAVTFYSPTLSCSFF